MRGALGAALLLAAAAGFAQDGRAARLSERARQDREIVYFLRPPETHAFDLHHDLTESREGVDRYLNVVRPGSTVKDPKAVVLDTGETLPVETLKGDAIVKAAIDIGEPVRPESEVVVIRFPKLATGQTLRLRIDKTYRDPKSYFVEGDRLVFARSLGIRRNSVVLPPGHELVACNVPAQVLQEADGRIKVSFMNPGPDAASVVVKARRLP